MRTGVLRPVGQSLWAACRSQREGGHASADSAEDTKGTTAVKPWGSTSTNSATLTFNAFATFSSVGELFVTHRCPMPVRSDNGPEFIAQSLRQWFAQLEISPLFIDAGRPWENSYIESFNGKFRDELLNRELFYTLREAQVVIERWRRISDEARPP
jgi:hypothetical protein